MSAQFEASRGQRILARFGVGSINEARVFHWCTVCKSYQSSDIINPISRSARTRCSNCGFESTLAPKGRAGGIALRLQMAIEAGNSSTNPAIRVARFLRVMYLGLSRKNMPAHRYGKTAAELEETATRDVGPWIMTGVSRLTNLDDLMS